MLLARNKKHKKGFTLIEALVLIGIFSISVLAFYRVFTLASYHIVQSKLRIAATALANERVEHIRNFAYSDIGTVAGSPSGLIDGDEVVTVNDIAYRVVIDIRNQDDPADGLAPTDALPNDYKRVQVYVLWGAATDTGVTTAQALSGTYKQFRVDVTAQFIPPDGLESANGDGLLAVNILDSNGDPVPTASVSVYHAGSPLVNMVGLADATGNYVTSLPERDDYRITIAKAGYETIVSEPPYNGSTQLYEPVSRHQSIVEGQLTTTTIITDPVSDFEVNVRDPFCQPFSPGVAFDFDIEGGRILGTDPTNGDEPVFALDSSLTTDTDGDVEVYTDTDGDGTIETSGDDEASSGAYTLTLTEPGFTLWKLNPGDDIRRDITSAEPGASACNFIVLDDAYDSTLIEVIDSSSGDDVAVVDANVRLRNIAEAYDVTQTTDKYGMVFFPEDASVTLTNGAEYDLRVSADGYFDKNVSVTITGLETPTIELTPTP